MCFVCEQERSFRTFCEIEGKGNEFCKKFEFDVNGKEKLMNFLWNVIFVCFSGKIIEI